jgi:hypothetical protein
MKKSLLLGILGLATAAVTSYGQGFISLDNYAYPGGFVSYGPGVPADGVNAGLGLGVLGTGLNSSWTVGVYYVLGTPAITDPASIAIPVAPLALGTGGGSTAPIVAPGIFLASSYFAVPGGAVGGTATFEVVAYPTVDGSYAAAAYRGHSAPFTLTMMSGIAVPPTANAGPAFTTFSTSPVPEPGTLALVGLGGLSLLLFRRKKA